MSKSIKVMLVDDHQIILDSLGLLFNMMEDVEVAACINDSREVIPALEKEMVDVLITDLTMPYMDGIQLTFEVKKHFPNLKILMLTVADQGDAIQDAYRAGISGYVMKKANRQELEEAIRTVGSGKMFFGHEVMKTMLTQQNNSNHKDLHAEEKIRQLTKRELEIIKLISQELSSNEIAEKLFISVGTVETHRHNIMRKLDVKNAIGVIKFALKYELV